MRFKKYFAENEDVRSLLGLYEESQGYLYHYRGEGTAKTIVKDNGFRFSRADQFLDQNEINHGLALLKEAAEKILDSEKKASFISILETINKSLGSCYIFCLSKDGKNQHLLEKYSDGKTVIRLEEDFSFWVNCSWHVINGSIHYINDLYRIHEGFVEYSLSRKKEIAGKVCSAFKKLVEETTHIVDQFHFIDVISKFIILSKREEYSKEAEYRIVLIAKDKINNKFEEEKKGRIFINPKMILKEVKPEIIKI